MHMLISSLPPTLFPRSFSVHMLVPCYKEPLEVVAATLLAALDARLPALTQRTVYLLDDGNSPEKRDYVEGLCSPHVRYITGRERSPGQINGKSENLNNALRNHIFAKYCTLPPAISASGGAAPDPAATAAAVIDWKLVPARELVIVFDADMRAKPEFLLKTLEVMADESCQLVLTPQAFHNIEPEKDLFNNINKQFWEVRTRCAYRHLGPSLIPPYRSAFCFAPPNRPRPDAKRFSL